MAHALAAQPIEDSYPISASLLSLSDGCISIILVIQNVLVRRITCLAQSWFMIHLHSNIYPIYCMWGWEGGEGGEGGVNRSNEMNKFKRNVE